MERAVMEYLRWVLFNMENAGCCHALQVSMEVGYVFHGECGPQPDLQVGIGQMPLCLYSTCRNVVYPNKDLNFLLYYYIVMSSSVTCSCEAWIRKGDSKDVICHEVMRVRIENLMVRSRGLGPFKRRFGFFDFSIFSWLGSMGLSIASPILEPVFEVPLSLVEGVFWRGITAVTESSKETSNGRYNNYCSQDYEDCPE
ncbi:hypothetical protein HHK36_024947 [Tetracentron sinense]|uniref:Uncharacterized protein n=1 Tax=Tetracentron sinense TaxID=13715 RepID=A0A835D554_TETSI|nr:hypothetical protein HHK36_024947 [Tetracentron sinense]